MAKRFKALTCEVLARQVYLCAAYSPNIVDVELLKRELHNSPHVLREALQARIDAAAGQGYAAVLLAYGLCGRSVAGLRAKDVLLVLPRAHDCITLYLGSRARYDKEFTDNPCTYWFSLDYLERTSDKGLVVLGASNAALGMEGTYQEYVEKYGQDNADYLMRVMGAWQAHYRRAVFVDTGLGDGSTAEAEARRFALERGWRFGRVASDGNLIRRLIDGEWDDDFLIVPPGEEIVQQMSEEIVASRPPESG